MNDRQHTSAVGFTSFFLIPVVTKVVDELVVTFTERHVILE